MNKNVLLLSINNQCSIVQNAVALYYEAQEDITLVTELLRLKEMLDCYINHSPQI